MIDWLIVCNRFFFVSFENISLGIYGVTNCYEDKALNQLISIIYTLGTHCSKLENYQEKGD